MPSALVSTEIVIGTLLVIAVVVLATTFLRRRYIAKGLPLTLCAACAGRHPTAGAWGSSGSATTPSSGTPSGASPCARATAGCASACSSTPRSRSRGGDSIPLLPDASRVPCSDGDNDFELALQGPAYTALRSWQEAAPPGYNVNVA